MLGLIIEILYNLSVLVLFLIIIYKISRERYLIVSSLVFWFIFFYFCYLAFPCLFIEEINKRWFFSQLTIDISRCIVFIYNLSFSFILFSFCYGDKTLSEAFLLKQRCLFVYQAALFIEVVSTCVILFAVLKLINIRSGISGLRAYFLIREAAESLEAKYHIRMILYLLISSSFYLFWYKRRIRYFLPLFGIIIFETLAGKRTTAFIVLLYLYVIYAISRKKLALKIIIPIMSVLLIGVLFVRAKALESEMGLSVVFGEFFETFTTLPYIVEKDLFGKGFLLERVLSDYTFASFLPGMLKVNIISYLSSGSEIARYVGKGYGLGSNFISEQIFEFGLVGYITVFFVPLIIIYFDKMLKGINNLIIKIVFIFQLRLYVREGISQFMISFYIIILYQSFFYFLRRKNVVFYSKVNQ